MSHIHDELVAAQEREFPGSEILTFEQVRDRWLTQPIPGAPGCCQYTDAAPSIALALLQHTVIVFYEYHGHRGARYGVEGSQYISGFGRD